MTLKAIPDEVNSFLKARQKLFINGKWVEPVNGECFPVYNPSTDKVVTYAAKGDAEDIDKAVKVARQAFEGFDWQNINAHQRGELLFKLADLIERDLELLAVLE